jgi:hypothetical protein
MRFFPNIISNKIGKKYLRHLGITHRPYAFYPANFWSHKNHRMLFTAWGIFIARNPKAKLDLVLAGTIGNHKKELKEDARIMGLEKRIHFIDLVKRQQMAAIWNGCSFLIFPSLYETSCIPLLEAMYFNKPLVCSELPILTRIAQDAAIYFDPRKPDSIVNRIEQISKDSTLRSDLGRHGKQRFEALKLNEEQETLARKLPLLFYGVKHYENSITGIYKDYWTDPEVIVTYQGSWLRRSIEFHFEAPPILPFSASNLYLRIKDGAIKKYSLPTGNEVAISQKLPRGPGFLTVWISPVFRPSEILNGSLDDRTLGCICHACRIISSNRERISLFDTSKLKSVA